MLTKLRSLSREIVPVHLYGNVSIDPSAVIAPGVLLQAEGNSRITIGAGACIGAGTIVRATGGNLEIGAGVCLGREVLIVGSGSIAQDACIGAGTTAIDPQIAEGAVIPTHSLLGDRSRSDVVGGEEGATNLDRDAEDVWNSPTPGRSTYPNFFKVKPPTVGERAAPPPTPSQEPPTPSGRSPAPDPPSVTVTTAIERRSTTYVSGRAQFDLLKRALFPNSGNNDETAQT